MAFLLKVDLYRQILQDELEEITREDDAIINSSISAAIAEMKTYLYDSYDTDLIFGATDADRHPLLLNLAADITIYYLVARCQAGIDMTDRKSRYDRAIKWLINVQKQKNYPDLPKREETVQSHVKYGSNEKRSNYF